MNILLLRAYPRKNGYTHRLTDLFVKGMNEAGGAVLVDRDIASAHIKPCIGCYRCWITSPGRCFFKDDMITLQEDFLNADIIVCATPLNSFSVSSSLKALLDRTLPLTMPRFERSPLGSVRNQLRFPEKWPKKIATIIVGAFNGPNIFSGVRSMMAHYANALSFEQCGELLRPESFLLPFTLAKPMTVKTIEAAFVRAGWEIATDGRISADTEQKAATPLSSDVDYFKKYSNIYWEHAVALGENSWDIDRLCRSVTSDVRILMQEMARSIDPQATAKLKAAFQFEFPDKNLCISLIVNRGACAYAEEPLKKDFPGSEAADLTVTCSSEVWAGVFMRQTNVRDALVSKQIVLKGDKSLFSRLDRYFPPPIM